MPKLIWVSQEGFNKTALCLLKEATQRFNERIKDCEVVSHTITVCDGGDTVIIAAIVK